MFAYFLERLSERSTWLGMIGILGALGVNASPEYSDAILSIGTSVAGGILTFTKG